MNLRCLFGHKWSYSLSVEYRFCVKCEELQNLNSKNRYEKFYFYNKTYKLSDFKKLFYATDIKFEHELDEIDKILYDIN